MEKIIDKINYLISAGHEIIKYNEDDSEIVAIQSIMVQKHDFDDYSAMVCGIVYPLRNDEAKFCFDYLTADIKSRIRFVHKYLSMRTPTNFVISAEDMSKIINGKRIDRAS